MEPVDLHSPTSVGADPAETGAEAPRSALVHGPSWTAVWPAPRRLSGPAKLRGLLTVDFDGAHERPTLGRVTGLWVIVQTIDQSDGNRSDVSRVVPGSLQLRPVAISPRWFDRGHGRPDEGTPPPPRPGDRFPVLAGPPPPPTPWVCETGGAV